MRYLTNQPSIPQSPEVARSSFDVFLCYDSANRDAAIELAKALKLRGLSPWLDIWELPPGRPILEELERILETIPVAIVVIGRGQGPWQQQEVRICLEEFVRRKLPVIPVLIRDTSEEPELPLFLRGFSWVDLHEGIDDEGLDLLIWGITGKKPERSY